jgi:hypothetical protein
MSIRDPEVLEALRDQPELLAIADAVDETQRLPTSSRRRVVSRSAALVAVGVAVLVAVLLWPSGSSRNPVLDRALAAIGEGPILHLVTQMPTGQEFVNLDTGRSSTPTFELETWSDRSMSRLHLLMREDGRVVGEILFPQDRTPDMHIGPVDPSYAALWSGYRKALADGKAKVAGEGKLYGHQVYWLQFNSRVAPDNEVAVDRSTYEPVAFRTNGSGRHVDTRVLLFRMEPFSSSDFERQTSGPNPLTGESHGSRVQVGPVGPGEPAEHAKPWLTAGPSIAGLANTAVHPTQITSDTGTSNGFQLVYGPEDGIRRSLTVEEAKHPDDPSEWKGIPNGSMRISAGRGSEGTSEGKQSEYTVWTGSLVLDGVYVTITTGVSREAVLEAARALRPA